jgi:hypothetical protein
VAVDIRRGSPTFGSALTVRLSERDRRQMFIRKGFPHGFCMLSDAGAFYKIRGNGFHALEAEQEVKETVLNRRRMALIDKRERWGLTLWGFLAVLTVAVVVFVNVVPEIHGFLACRDPVRGEILVVEGWIPDYAIPGVISEFEMHGYKVLVVVGGPILMGSHVSGFKSYAELARVRLKALGAHEEKIVVLETEDVKMDRTYQSARAVQQWLSSDKSGLRGLDVYTLGAHARRSRLLFRKVFGDSVAVGAIAASNQSYDSESWWRSSNGARTVLGELIGYLYAAVFFREENS